MNTNDVRGAGWTYPSFRAARPSSGRGSPSTTSAVVEAGHLGRRTAAQARPRQLSDRRGRGSTRFRSAMAVRPDRRTAGEVEIDESYLGGAEAGKPGAGGREEGDRRRRGGEVRAGLWPGPTWLDRRRLGRRPRSLRRKTPRQWRNRPHRWLAWLWRSSARPAIGTSSGHCPSSIRPLPGCCCGFTCSSR